MIMQIKIKKKNTQGYTATKERNKIVHKFKN